VALIRATSAGYENRLARVETRLELLTWMVGFMLAMQVAILFKLFWH
jgi:hypothetical protein